jgi:hypothetical protein
MRRQHQIIPNPRTANDALAVTNGAVTIGYIVIRYLTGACGKSSAAPDTTGAIVNAPPKSGAGRRLLERATCDVSINLVQ